MIKVYDFSNFLLSRAFSGKKFNFSGNPGIAKCTTEHVPCTIPCTMENVPWQNVTQFRLKIYGRLKKGLLQLVSNYSIFVPNGR